MKYIVYQTANKLNGKLYIGVHKTKDPNSFDGYIGNGIYVGYSLENPKTPYQKALKKYGYSNFVRTTLKEFDSEEDAYDYESQIVTLEFIRRDNNYNIKTGGIHGSWNFKNVYQYDFNGKLIKEWNSISDIIEYYSCNPNRIHMASINKYSAFESYWSYFDEELKLEEYRKCKHSELYQFDYIGNLINVFRNTVEANNKLDLNITSLNEAVSKKKSYMNYFWTKNPDMIFSIIKSEQDNKITAKRIYEYNSDLSFNCEYFKLSEASNILNCESEELRSHLRIGSIFNEKYYSYEKLDKFQPYKPKVENKKIEQYDYNTGKLIKVWETITECAKFHPKCRDVIKGGRNHTHGYTFKYLDE